MKTVLAILCFCSLAFGADHYIYASASGSGTGANCTNAYTGFGTGAKQINPASMVRGDTYWILAGTYTAPTFSTADSGTTVITVESATAASHGGASDCSGLYGQAVLSGVTTVSTDYWTFNGQTRGSDWRSGYNLKFNNASNGSANGALTLNYPGSVTGVTVEYCEIEGTNDNYSGSNTDGGIATGGGLTSFYAGYNWIHDVGTDLVVMFTGNNATFEYNMFERNHTGLDSNHSQAIGIGDFGTSGGSGQFICRYNQFRDITNTGIIDNDNDGGTTFTPHWYIYGNVVYWTTSVHLSGTSGLADGLVSFFGEKMNGGVVQIYNNTFAGINGSACTSSVICSEYPLFAAGSADTCGASCPAVTVYNNLGWNPQEAQTVAISSGSPAWTPTSGYSEFYCAASCSNGGGYTLNANGATHDVGSNTGSPFVNFDGSSNFNFGLSANTPAGLSIAGWSSAPPGCTSGTNCEDSDPLGIVRGANGTVDRGAFQIAAAATNGGAISGAGSMAGTGSVQ